MAYWAHCGKTLSSYFNLWDKTNFEDKHHLICYAKSRTMLLKLDAAYKKRLKDYNESEHASLKLKLNIEKEDLSLIW